MTKTMAAKFAGKCVECKGPIAAGELIVWRSGIGARHATTALCAASKATMQPVAAVVPTTTMDATKIALFLRAARERGLKAPKVRFLAPSGGELLLTLAGSTSKNPGAVFVKLNGEYLGSVAVDGGVRGQLAKNDAVLGTLAAITVDPAKAAKAYGALTCRCSFCGLTLTDAGSVEVGYGPICAERYGLPHTPKGTPALTVPVDNGGNFSEPDSVDRADAYYSAQLGF